MSNLIEDALNSRPTSKPRSLGIKLIVICVLALLMNIPGFFVQGLLDDRIHNNSPVIQHPDGSSTFATVDYYQSVDRSLKYILLFEGLVFLTYFTFEVTSKRRMHAAQYVLVGVAQVIFYLLLLSLAEKIGFDYAFLVAGGATVGLLSTNAGWVFASRIQGLKALITFSPLYGLIYVLLRLKDYALLVGSIASFAAVALLMYFTRRIDWDGSFPLADSELGTHVSPVPKSAS